MHQRHRRSHQSSINERQRAEIAGDRIPCLRNEKTPAKFGPRLRRKDPELIHQQHGDQQEGRRRDQRDEMRDLIGASHTAQQRPRIPSEIRGRCCIWCSGHLSGFELGYPKSYWIFAIAFISLATTSFGSFA